MKFPRWILFLLISSHAFAQGVEIEPAPLSVEDDGTRKIIIRNEGESAPVEKAKDVIAPPVAEALVIPNDDVINPPEGAVKTQPVNPIDGQLKLEATSATVSEIAPAENNVSEELFSEYQSHILNKYLQLSFGFLNSKYKKIHPSLENGSTMMSFKFVADVSTRVQSGFAVEVLNDKNGQTVPDSIRVLQYRLFFDYHAPLLSKDALKVDWMAGLGLSAGDFGIRRRYTNELGQEVSVKLKDGIIVGLIPTAGVRIYVFDKNSFDIMVEYHQYFSTPQKHIGGLAIAPRFSFEY
jgi:hypothetical protein